ncbi:MAG: isoprenylcysteine carboxylmethyltransferase family protein [Chthoniobacterales bacterium]|nr:MAG: isoprenylcysteine carboxylmethyltransferase family protein [Chthoniobacterales bacterium]
MNAYLLAVNVVRACWTIFLVVWLVTGFSTKRTVYRESSARRLRYWLLLIGAYVLLAYSHHLPFPFDHRLFPRLPQIAWLGAALCLAGLVFCVWARFVLGRNWSGVVTLKEEHELIVRGPYRCVRHPIYTGLITMYLGTAIVAGYFGGVIGIVLVFASFWIKLGDEEKLMSRQFPGEYADYQARVKRIVPFLF